MPTFRSVAPAVVVAFALSCGQPAVPPRDVPPDAGDSRSAERPDVHAAGLKVAFDPPGQSRDGADPREARGVHKWIVRLAGPVREEQKQAIVSAGGRIGEYLPELAFVVTADAAARARIEQLPFVSGVARQRPEHRLHPGLRGAGRSGRQRLHVIADDAQALLRVLAEVNRSGGKVLDVGRDVARVEVDAREIDALSALEDVVWIAPASDLRLLNDTTRWAVQSNVPSQTPAWSAGLHGEGQVIGIGDGGLDHDMPWFRDPAGAPIGPTHRKLQLYDATWGDGYDSDEPGHGTHVAGTVGGDRTPVDGGTTGNGMAPKARFVIQDLSPGDTSYVYPPSDLGDLFVTAYDSGARLHTNSWGGGGASYGVEASSADRFAWEHPDFLPLFANGNGGSGSGTVITPATAKNVVSVGATLNGSGDGNVASFSSHGPTADGRIKPTVSAPGDGVTEGAGIMSADSDGVASSFNSGLRAMRGTSMATPAAAGAAALIRQYFASGYHPSGAPNPADAFAPSAALVKAALIASAEGMAGAYTGGPAPSMGQGFGRVNLATALALAGGGRTLEVVEGAGLATEGAWTHTYLVAGGGPLKVTLVWTDAPGTPAASRALVNDLDLVVTAPDGRTYPGNAFLNGASDPDGAPDRLNVEEQVLLPDPLPGYYAVSVSAYNVPVGPQPFALVVTGASPVTSLGAVMLDRHRYRPTGVARVVVADRDLDLDPAGPDTASVRISTTSEPGGEAVALVETGPSSGVFEGAIELAAGGPVPGDGLVAARDGDAVTAVYEDAHDGTAGPATRTATASVDGRPPAISGVESETLSEGSARVRWTTDEPADSAVEHGPTPALGLRAAGLRLSTSHALDVGGLLEATTYFFDVLSTDEAGNVARDDASGQRHSFTTPSVPPTLTAASSEGFQTASPSARIFGTARDATLAQVTVAGAPVPVRSTDGYFEVQVDLAVGSNVFPVVATDSLGATATVTVTVYRVLPSDLVVTSFTAPPQGGTGTRVSVTFTVVNAGTAGTSCFEEYGWCYVDFYCHPAGSSGLGTHLGGSRILDLAAGASLTRTVDVPLPIAQSAGTYVLEAFADAANQIPESDETNNRRAAEPFTMLLPDLAFTELWGSTPALSGAPIAIHDTLSNLGGGASQPVYVDLYLSKDAALGPGDTFLGYRRIQTYLQPGTSSTEDTVVQLPHGLLGTYYLGAAVAEFSYWPFPEVDETNNTLTVPIQILGPDFRMLAVSGPATAGTGATITVTDTLSADPAGAPGGPMCVGLYLSKDAVISAAADTRIGERCLSGIAPGETSTGTATATLPFGIAGGDYVLGAVADHGGQYPESNETNNAVAGNAITILLPDLSTTAVAAPAIAYTGATIPVSDTVAIDPADGRAPSFYVGYFLSTDEAVSLADTLLGGRWATLDAGGTSSGAATVTIPTGLWGTLYLGAYADSFHEEYDGPLGPDVPESNEANNARLAGPIQIVGSDVSVVQVSGPASAVRGSTFTVRTTVTNAAAAGRSSQIAISVYASPDPVITSSDPRVSFAVRSIAALAPGQSGSVDSPVYLSASAFPAGTTWYLGAIATVAEANRADNVATGNAIAITAQ